MRKTCLRRRRASGVAASAAVGGGWARLLLHGRRFDLLLEQVRLLSQYDRGGSGCSRRISIWKWPGARASTGSAAPCGDLRAVDLGHEEACRVGSPSARDGSMRLVWVAGGDRSSLACWASSGSKSSIARYPKLRTSRSSGIHREREPPFVSFFFLFLGRRRRRWRF